MTTLATLPTTREQDELLALYSNPDTCPADALEPRPLVEEPAFISWQQDIPREYLELSPEELDRRIRYARAVLGKRLVVLGHHYQRDEVIQYADFTGDSFGLSQHAAAQTDAEFVVFCGVHFMAESADILTPPHVRVMLPNMAAGCSMADMADPDDVYAAWDDITAAMGGEGKVIPITYMNSMATLKAFVGEHEGLVLWNWRFPGGGLSEEQIRKAKVILWQGHCSTHQRFSVAQIEKAREEHPEVRVIVHPETKWEVMQAADDWGSTAKIVKEITAAPAGSIWAVGTEINLVNRLAKANPDKTVFC